MKATVEKSMCLGCGVCASIASAIFALGEDGLAENIIGDEIPADLEGAAQEACDSCPASAIIVE